MEALGKAWRRLHALLVSQANRRFFPAFRAYGAPSQSYRWHSVSRKPRFYSKTRISHISLLASHPEPYFSLLALTGFSYAELAGRDLVARAHCLGHSPPSNLSSPCAIYTSSLLSYLISQGTKKAMHLLAEKPLAAT